MRTLVFNGWAAGREVWSLCAFRRDWVFDYLEQLDGLPEKVMDETDEAVLVGFSMGGSTALRLALRDPGKVRGLLLVSATARMMEERGADGREDWKGMSLRRRAALMMGTRLVFRDNPSPLYAAENLERGLDYLQRTDLRSELRAAAARGLFRFPVAILQSERDGIVRPQNAPFLRSVFPQARVTLVPGGEHVLPVAAPELVDAEFARIIVGQSLEGRICRGQGVPALPVRTASLCKGETPPP